MSNHLVIFTRFPVPGKTKTRLIPALGADAAADLQRRLTEHTLAGMMPLADAGVCAIEIRFADATLSEMQNWLGERHRLRSQCEGDLGERMAEAFSNAFEGGAQRCAIIGIDCPALTANHVQQAFDALASSDLALGPATDGGYYLIGLTRAGAGSVVPGLFDGMAWGSDTVLEDTLRRATHARVTHALLEPLDDVDRPEDLAQLDVSALKASPREADQTDPGDGDHA